MGEQLQKSRQACREQVRRALEASDPGEQDKLCPSDLRPARQQITMDGVLIHVDGKWREAKLGSVYCQVVTARDIREGKADYLLVVKDNQESLCEAVTRLSETNRREGCLPMTVSRTLDKDHGRIEVRRGYQIRVADWLQASDP